MQPSSPNIVNTDPGFASKIRPISLNPARCFHKTKARVRSSWVNVSFIRFIHSSQADQYCSVTVALTTWIYSDVLCRRAKKRYPFVKSHSTDCPVRLLHQALELHTNGYYKWSQRRECQRDKITSTCSVPSSRSSWKAAATLVTATFIWIYWRQIYRANVAVFYDWCSIARYGYNAVKRCYGDKPDIVAANTLNRGFIVAAPNQLWDSGITYTHNLRAFCF